MELQNAVKDPISNFGVVMGEVAKRSKSSLGLGSGNTLADKVHPNLVDVASHVCKNTEMFGNAVEKLLIKHGNILEIKRVMQFLCMGTIFYTYI